MGCGNSTEETTADDGRDDRHRGMPTRFASPANHYPPSATCEDDDVVPKDDWNPQGLEVRPAGAKTKSPPCEAATPPVPGSLRNIMSASPEPWRDNNELSGSRHHGSDSQSSRRFSTFSKFSVGGGFQPRAEDDPDYNDASNLSLTSEEEDQDISGTNGASDSNIKSDFSGSNFWGSQTPGGSTGFNPYQEIQEKMQKKPRNNNSNNRATASVSTKEVSSKSTGTTDLGMTGLSNLSNLMPRPKDEIASLRRNFTGGIEHPDIQPDVYLPSSEERLAARLEEISSWNLDRDPTAVLGKGLLLCHPVHGNEPLPIEAFPQTAPRYDTRYFVRSCSTIRDHFDAGKFVSAIGLAEALEGLAVSQRLAFVNSLFKQVSVKLRDLFYLVRDKKGFLQALREHDVEGYRAAFDLYTIECGSLGGTPGSRLQGSSTSMGTMGSAVLDAGNLSSSTIVDELPPGQVPMSSQNTQMAILRPPQRGGVVSPKNSMAPTLPDMPSRPLSSGAKFLQDLGDDSSNSRLSYSGSSTVKQGVAPSGFVSWLKQTLGTEIQYALLVAECFLRTRLTEEQLKRHGAWSPPPPISSVD